MGDIGMASSTSGWGRFLGGGQSNPLQYSCLENPMDRGAWQNTVHGVAKSWTQLKQLSTHTHKHYCMPTLQVRKLRPTRENIKSLFDFSGDFCQLGPWLSRNQWVWQSLTHWASADFSGFCCIVIFNCLLSLCSVLQAIPEASGSRCGINPK